MPAPVTDIAEVRRRRAACEARILADLKQLCADTGGDLEKVQVFTIVIPAGDGDAPQVWPDAIKVVLAF